jgi:outer membrane receptor protein involved in Fe transport
VTTTPEGLPRTETRQQRYAAYATDDWKVSRKLTLNYGVRWEYNTPAVDVEGLWRSLSFDVRTNGLPTVVPNIGTEYEFYRPQKALFMPRFGFAYRPTDRLGYPWWSWYLQQRSPAEQLHYSQPQPAEVGNEQLCQHGDWRARSPTRRPSRC